ncbi:MAG: CBS domain-containing protein [Bacillota bacterium]
MDIIVSHNLTDLDGLGAMIAAGKLYPEAKAVFVGRLHQTVKDFLVLYKDEIETYTLDEIELENVDRVIMVDTNKKEMTGELEERLDWENCEVIIYDHHPHDKEEWVTLDLSENVGSATTILVNRLVAKDIKINPFEATLGALAIYADTGNLTYLNTTFSDAHALAYLLESGANLKLINDFIKEPLNEEQQELLERLLEFKDDLNIDGINISIFAIEYDKYIAGINRVVEQIKQLYSIDTLFIIFVNDNKGELIGRSSDEAVDIGKICSALNGGGHAGAGAARLRDITLEEAKDELVSVINEKVKPLFRVRKIMSSPVRTVSPDTSIEEVELLMKKFGHNALVVVENEKVVGIFSRSDLSKVKGHNLMHAPVKAYMTRDVITVDASIPVSKAQQIMVEYGIGRLPVENKGKLAGIVTRSNILSSYYGSETPYQHKHRYGSSMVDIEENERDVSGKINQLSDGVINLLKKCGQVADQNEVNVYLIGGMVRDLLLDIDNRDLDLVVDGSLEKYLPSLSKELGGQYSYNRQFRTGSINLPTGTTIDLASARREIYPYTGALPEVESTNIVEDLFRRDYTINALAIKLNPEHWGQLIDSFAAEKDLKDGLLRSLHRFSFLDDPTRIIRGIRLANRLGFTFEEETATLIKEALDTADFSRLSPDRVIKEFELLFNNKLTEDLMDLLKEYPIFKLLDIDTNIDKRYYCEISVLEDYLAELREKNYNIDTWVVRLAIFSNEWDPDIVNDWNIKNRHKDVITIYSKSSNFLKKMDKDLDSVDIVAECSRFSNEELLVLLVKTDNNKVVSNIKNYLNNLQKIHLEINGNDLIELGFQPGPVMKDVLDEIYKEKLRGNLLNRGQELEMAKSIYEEMNNK